MFNCLSVSYQDLPPLWEDHTKQLHDMRVNGSERRHCFTEMVLEGKLIYRSMTLHEACYQQLFQY